MKSLFKTLMIFAVLIIQPMPSHAGSGIGGAVTSSIISWCDDASIMIRETREEALSRLNHNNDRIGTLRIFYQGFVAAAASSEDTEQDVGTSLTFRAIARGVRLAQLLGIPSIVNGEVVSNDLAGDKRLQGLIQFMDWYSLFVEETANAVDRTYYVPYRHNRENVTFSTMKLENELVNLSLSLLRSLQNQFLALKADRSSYFTKVPVTQYFQSLAYFSSEVSSDLNETVFASSLECQSKRLLKLSRQAQGYLDGRVSNDEDASKLNKFTLDLKAILKSIELRTCR